jgi:pimeloyl-ACP methyl ester carboxylesterase
MRRVFVTTLANPKALVFGLVMLPASGDTVLAYGFFLGLIVAVAVAWAALGASLARFSPMGQSRTRRLLRKGAAFWLAALSLGRAARLARDLPGKVAGLVTVAAAPDFTERMWSHEFSPADRAALLEAGVVYRPSDYSDDPYPITQRLIEDGRNNLVLDQPLALSVPVRLLQGTADSDVPAQVALELLADVDSPDLRLTLIKDADHRFSTPACLGMITDAVQGLLDLREGQASAPAHL